MLLLIVVNPEKLVPNKRSLQNNMATERMLLVQEMAESFGGTRKREVTQAQ